MEENKCRIFSYSPFGYEGSLVIVEVDLRRGIPAVDIVGLADGSVKECRERIQAAFRNSNKDFPSERVLISLSPADLRKEGAGFDLAVALGIIEAQSPDKCIKDSIMVLGELELSGNIRPIRGVHAAIVTAKANGIEKFIIPSQNLKESEGIENIYVAGVNNLCEAEEYLIGKRTFIKTSGDKDTLEEEVLFNYEHDEYVHNLKLPRKLIRVLEIAAAGKHNLLITGTPGSGKTMAVQGIIPAITPLLTKEESMPTTRIWSLAGLMKPSTSNILVTPFRMPHQTASIEGICGGGPNCRPGEISLSHNGILFLDEAAEFRTSVLQMLRVPLESKSITLSRAGRTTVYPANFQLIMATSPCPCGNYGSKTKICLCSARSVSQWWQKFSMPLLDRINLIYQQELDEELELCEVNISELRLHIRNAFEIQRRNKVYNQNLSPWDLAEKAKLDNEALSVIDDFCIKHDLQGTRRESSLLKVACTIANMDAREVINANDVREAISFSKTFNLATL